MIKRVQVVPFGRTGDRLIDDQFRRVAEATQALGGQPFSESALITTDDDGSDGILFAVGVPRLVSHKLGRPARAFFVVQMVTENVNMLVAPAYTSDVDIALQIRVESTSNGRCYLLVL